MPEQVARLADGLRRLAGGLMPAHPAIVSALDAGLEGTTAFLASEYVAAETLDVALRHLAPAPLERALPILAAMADAIDAAWASGVGHGALHPRDVFVTDGDSAARITGFGVVSAVEAVGHRAPARRPYMAPERVNGDVWDVRADVYALGAIAHELLTRRRPAGTGEQDGALTTGTTPSQRVQIRRVLSAVLAEHPQHRFQTARAFTDALAAIARGDVPAAWPTEPETDETVEAEGDAGRAVEVLTSGPAAPPAPAKPEPPLFAFADSAAAVDAAVEPPAPVAPAATAEPVEPEVPRSAPVVPHPALRTPHFAPDPPHPEPDFEHVALRIPHSAPPEVSSPFPWSAMAAVAVAGIAVGIVIGYLIGHRPQVSAPKAPSMTVTDVPVTPEPAVDRDMPTPAAARESAAASDAPASKPAPRPGRLVVRSVPPGALVVVDGRARGPSPATVTGLALGAHTIEVGRPGFVPQRQTITLTARAASRDVSLRLQPGVEQGGSAGVRAAAATGSLFVDSRPQTARVMIDGQYRGVTPLRVPALQAGTHAIRIERNGFGSFSTSVSVKAGEPARVTATLEEQRDE